MGEHNPLPIGSILDDDCPQYTLGQTSEPVFLELRDERTCRLLGGFAASYFPRRPYESWYLAVLPRVPVCFADEETHSVESRTICMRYREVHEPETGARWIVLSVREDDMDAIKEMKAYTHDGTKFTRPTPEEFWGTGRNY